MAGDRTILASRIYVLRTEEKTSGKSHLGTVAEERGERRAWIEEYPHAQRHDGI